MSKPTNVDINQGKDMLNIPFGELISSVAKGMADAQWELDKSSMVVAEMMSGSRVLRDLDTGKPERDSNNKLIIDDSRVFFGYTPQPQGFGAVGTARLPNASSGLKSVEIVKIGKVKDKKKEPKAIVEGDGKGAKVKVKMDGRSGKITKVEVTSSGSGYTTPPIIKITGLDPKDLPSFRTRLYDRKGPVDYVDVSERGEGYTIRPVVNIIGEGTGAEAKAIMDGNGKIADIQITRKGEGYDPNNTFVEIIPQPKMVPQKLSMIELGFVPNFYQFVDTVIKMKIALTITRDGNGEYNLQAATVNANYSSSYDYKMELAASVETKIVPIPPPTVLEERIRKISDLPLPEYNATRKDNILKSVFSKQ